MNTPIPFKLKITFFSPTEKLRFEYKNLSDFNSEITLPEPNTVIGIGSIFTRKNKTKYKVKEIEISENLDKNDDANFEIVYHILKV